MQVILLSDVEKVGLRGDVVEVARGYARNFLLPRRLAETATPAKVAELERRDAQRARHDAKTVDEARDLASKLEQARLVFEAKAGPTGGLFGSVTATNVVDRLWEQLKIRVDRRKVELPDPIKRVGVYRVPIDLFTDVRVEVPTYVVPEGTSVEDFEAAQAAAEAEAEAAAEADAAVAETDAAPPAVAEPAAADEPAEAQEEAEPAEAAAEPEADEPVEATPDEGEADRA